MGYLLTFIISVLTLIMPTDDFHNNYTYDPDGNLLTLNRYAFTKIPAVTPLLMDSFNYYYFSGVNDNRLSSLTDNAFNIGFQDVAYRTDSTIAMYQYDQTGNTTKDLVAGQDSIEWNLYNKVIKARNVDGISTLSYRYDGMGNRVSKTYTKDNGTTLEKKTDYYVRDAQGNILATYNEFTKKEPSTNTDTRIFSLSGHDIYGSARLGTRGYWPLQLGEGWDYFNGVYDTIRLRERKPWYSLEYQDVIRHDKLDPYGNTLTAKLVSADLTGQKQYEVTDHLGNVLATVSDARQSNGDTTHTDSLTILSYGPAVTSMSDYYPFGMLMPTRHYSDNSGHTTTISQTVLAPQLHTVVIPWADGGATAFGTGTTAGTGSPLVLNDTYPFGGGGLTYTIHPLNSGLTAGLTITVTAVSGFGNWQAEVSQGASSTGFFTINSVGGHTASITVPVSGTATLTIKNFGANGQVSISAIKLDTFAFVPVSAVSQISSDNEYKYGFNGQMKDNEWAGVGNHTSALYWEYDTRTARRGNRDPVVKPWESSYATLSGNPIENSDPLGDYDKPTNTWERFWNSITGRGYINRGYDKYNELKSYGANAWYDVNEQQVTITQIVSEHIEGNTTGGYTVVDNGQIFVYEKDGGREYNYAIGTSDYVEAHGGSFPHFTHIPPIMGIGPDVSLSGGSVLKGFKSFRAFKRSFGSAGEGMAWHHIVGQYASNISKFGAETIHNPNNLIKLEHGAGSIHQKVSDYYSSKQRFTEGKTVREWLSTQSFEAQYEFGVKKLKDFGWKP